MIKSEKRQETKLYINIIPVLFKNMYMWTEKKKSYNDIHILTGISEQTF